MNYESQESSDAIDNSISSDIHNIDESDSLSTPEEERFKRLFSSCDLDGDGYIDSHGLTLMCQQLNMEDSADDLMAQLKGNESGKISIDDFLKCRSQLMGEIEALTSVMQHETYLMNPLLQSNQTFPLTPSTENSLNLNPTSIISKWSISPQAEVCPKQESWEFDSGARDLSPEPNTLQKLIEAAGGNIASGNSSSLLDLANKLHLAALASLKGEIFELSNRLQHLSQDRDLLAQQLTKAQLDKIEVTKCNDNRLDEQAQRYEERITELHGVIAELSKKLNYRHANVIAEEDEESHHSEVESRNSHFTSNDNNANESCSERDTEDTNPELCQLVSDLHSSVHMNQAMDSSQHTITEFSQPIRDCIEGATNQQLPNCEFGGLRSVANGLKAASTQSLQMNQLHDDMRILQQENKELRDRLTTQDIEMCRARNSITTLRDDKDRLIRKIQELQTKLQLIHTAHGSLDSSHKTNSCASPARSKSPHINLTTGERTPTSREDPTLIAKMAERVKLKKMECGDKQILGSEISNTGITSTKVAEHLVQHLHDESNAQEILQAICSTGSNISESKVREFEIETERLNSKIDHLKSQNDLLRITIEESRTQCDRLSILIGKYESNNTAMQLALNYSDQCLETFEVLMTLLESEQGLLLANYRAASIGGTGKHSSSEDEVEAAVLLKRAQENRKTAENLARHLLQRLDRNSNAIYCMPSSIPNPWNDLSSHNTSTSSTSSGSIDSDFTKGDEQRLREYINQFKSDRSSVRVTIMELESLHVDSLQEHSISILESQKLDLENAVLMQELMAMKEEKAELKAQVYLLEKEKSALELRLNTREAQEQAYRVHIDHLKAELLDKEQTIQRLGEYMPNASNKSCLNDLSSSGHSIDLPAILCELPKDLVEAGRREKKLKSRIHDLVTTLEKVTRNAELRHQQSADFVNDLKRANTAIIGAFERSKKKHQSKLKKIEQQMIAMMERHNHQVRVLKQKLEMKESESNVPSSNPGETAL